MYVIRESKPYDDKSEIELETKSDGIVISDDHQSIFLTYDEVEVICKLIKQLKLLNSVIKVKCPECDNENMEELFVVSNIENAMFCSKCGAIFDPKKRWIKD